MRHSTTGLHTRRSHSRSILANYHATLAQTSEKRQGRLLGIRAAMMAENLAYIVSREQGLGNVLVFAYNTHLKRGQEIS